MRCPRTYSGNVLGLTSEVSTSTKATVAFLSDSGSAPNTASIAAGPRSLSLATAFSVAGSAGFWVDLISVTRRSARKLEKKLIQPLPIGLRGPRETTAPAPRAA